MISKHHVRTEADGEEKASLASRVERAQRVASFRRSTKNSPQK